MKPPIEVPKEWIEGLIEMAGNISKETPIDPRMAIDVYGLVAFIKSAESFLKR